MNKFVAFVAAGVLSASALVAGTASAENGNSAFAQMVANNSTSAPAASDTVGYGYNAGFITKAAHQSNVKVIYVGELSQADKASFLDRAKANPASVQALRSEIAQNADLVRGLQVRNLKVSDVIGASHALDGSTTYIIR